VVPIEWSSPQQVDLLQGGCPQPWKQLQLRSPFIERK
jgi:hypothetical protein